MGSKLTERRKANKRRANKRWLKEFEYKQAHKWKPPEQWTWWSRFDFDLYGVAIGFLAIIVSIFYGIYKLIVWIF